MDEIGDRIKRILESSLRDCHAYVETEPNGRVTGHIVAGEFDGLTYEERRKRIRAAIDRGVDSNAITREDALNVSTLLTYTPEEWTVTLPDD